jgi:hypothetical protein
MHKEILGRETSLERHRARARRSEDSIKTLNTEINLNNILKSRPSL